MESFKLPSKNLSNPIFIFVKNILSFQESQKNCNGLINCIFVKCYFSDNITPLHLLNQLIMTEKLVALK